MIMQYFEIIFRPKSQPEEISVDKNRQRRRFPTIDEVMTSDDG